MILVGLKRLERLTNLQVFLSGKKYPSYFIAPNKNPLQLFYLQRFKIIWLPELDARRTSERQEIPLLVKIYVRKGKGGFITFY